MASTTAAGSQPVSAATTVAQIAEQAVVATVTAVAKDVQKSNSADLKDIVVGVSKEVASSAKADSKETLVKKIEDGGKEVAKDVVAGVEEAGKEIEQHPELVAEGAVVAAVAAVSVVAPELAIGGVAVIGKMAADNAKKTASKIAVDSSSVVVKEMSKDLTKDLGQDVKTATVPMTSGAEVGVEGKATEKADGAALATAETSSPLKPAGNGTVIDGSKVVTAVAVAQTAPSNTKAATTDTAPGLPDSGNSNLIAPAKDGAKEHSTIQKDDKQKAAKAPGADVKMATPSTTVELNQSPYTTNTSAATTTGSVPATDKDTSKRPLDEPQIVTSSSSNIQAAAIAPPSTSSAQHPVPSTAAIIPATETSALGAVPQESVAELHQKLNSIREALYHRESLNQLHQKVDAMTAILQNVTQLLADVSRAQSHAELKRAQSTATEIFPLNLITPPLPATTHVETRRDLALDHEGEGEGNGDHRGADADDVVGASMTSHVMVSASTSNLNSNLNSNPASLQKQATAKADRGSGSWNGVWKLFYLRS